MKRDIARQFKLQRYMRLLALNEMKCKSQRTNLNNNVAFQTSPIQAYSENSTFALQFQLVQPFL